MLTKKDVDWFWDQRKTSPQRLDFAGINYPYLSIMERHARSNLIKLLFADDESVATICDDAADQNQIQSLYEFNSLSQQHNRNK